MRIGSLAMAVCLVALPAALGDEAALEKVRDARKVVSETLGALTSRLRLTARVAEASGHTGRAVAAWRRLVDLDGEQTDNYFELLNLLIRANDAEAAAPVLERLQKLLPNDPRPVYFCALVQKAAGDTGAFEATCKKALGASANPGARMGIADFFDRLGYGEIAELELKMLARGNGRDAARAVVALAERAWILDDYGIALPYYERADAMLKGSGMELAGPERALTGYRLQLCKAAVALKNGHDPSAVAALRTLHEDRPDRIEAAVLLIREFRSLGEADLAETTRVKTAAVFRRMIESSSWASSGYNALAWFLALAGGDLEESETLSRKSLAIDSGTPEYLDTLAEILHRKGAHAEAIELIDYALAQRPAYREYFERQRHKFQQSLTEKGDSHVPAQ